MSGILGMREQWLWLGRWPWRYSEVAVFRCFEGMGTNLGGALDVRFAKLEDVIAVRRMNNWVNVCAF